MPPPRRPRTSRRWRCCSLTLTLTRARTPNQVEMQDANADPNPNLTLTPGQVEAYCHPPSADTLVFVCGLPAMYEVPPPYTMA